MPSNTFGHMKLPRTALFAFLSAAAVTACVSIPCNSAYAVTAAEKQAEADAVYAQIDSLQTSLNGVMEEYDRALAAYEEASAKADDAQIRIGEETQHLEILQDELASFAVGMYRQGDVGSFLDVLLESTSFEQFATAWDACATISNRGVTLIEKSEAARAKLEEAKETYEAEGRRAEDEMQTADEKREEIERTQEALREEAAKLTAEAARLQAEEELAAERARQAEEARKKREAELAAAAAAAEAARAAAEAQAEAQGSDASDAVASENVVMGTGFFTNPCPASTNSSGFGYRTFDNSFHKGLDMAAAEGTPYYAADSGTVMYATNDGGWNGGAGNWVVISHGNGIVTKYMHSSATFVKPGDFVERGQNIGLVGQTGEAFGAHLHFQVEVDGVAVNPLNYI